MQIETTAEQLEITVSELWKTSGGQKPSFLSFPWTKMNMSARVMFGRKGLTPKHLSFAFPQTDSLKKGSRSAGGRRRIFSFSLRCQLGIIRGRTKGKTDLSEADWLIFLLALVVPLICFLVAWRDGHRVALWSVWLFLKDDILAFLLMSCEKCCYFWRISQKDFTAL